MVRIAIADRIPRAVAARPRRPGRARVILGFAVLPLLVASCRIEVEPEEDTSLEPTVLAMLERSAAEWNRGDLDAFLADYQDSPATTLVVGEGVYSGLDEIRAHYAPFFARSSERETLRFEAVRVRSLSPLIGIVTARWVFDRSGVTNGSGALTLVMRRTGSGWKITHNHSSSDPLSATD
ncbi:MAG: nuclear transport factor 2 family protein [marine benthic group bacterium]|nr:nuclear transport factor 2 family protein [Gemmatimonadota bacterium]